MGGHDLESLFYRIHIGDVKIVSEDIEQGIYVAVKYGIYDVQQTA